MGLWILYAHTFIYICVDIGAIIYIYLYVQDIIYMDILSLSLYIYIYWLSSSQRLETRDA